MDDLDIISLAERVYSDLLSIPSTSIADIASRLHLAEQEVRRAFKVLGDLALVEPSADDDVPVPVPVNPHYGLQVLQSRQEAALAEMQARVHSLTAAAAQIVSRVDRARHPSAHIRHCVGVAEVRAQLAALSDSVEKEVLSLAPGGPQTPENIKASEPLSAALLDRGVALRTVFLDSIANDPASVDHVTWLTSRGAEVRTRPILPVRMIIVDRTTALVAVDDLDSSLGATVYSGPGIVAALCSLFDLQWEIARTLGQRPPREAQSLGVVEQTALELLIEGDTDEVVARRLGVSPRTARRIASGLMETLGARSRFQAGANAVYQGYVREEHDSSASRSRTEPDERLDTV